MSKSLDASFFIGNRQKLRKLFTDDAPLVLTAHGLLQRNGEYTFPFRQDSSFWYLTGIEVPDVIFIMDKDEEYLIMPERNQSQNIMEGTVNEDGLLNISGINDVIDYKSGWNRLSTRLKRAKKIATLVPPPKYVNQFGFYTNPARTNLIGQLKSVAKEAEIVDIRQQLLKLRTIKQPIELALLQKAINITGQALEKVKANLAKYNHEFEIEAELSSYYRLNGAKYHGFAPIVASGKHATIPHYFDNSGKLSSKDLIVIDTGAEVDNYTADLTRTYSYSEPTKRQKSVYDAVQDVQAFALKKIKPGITIKQYENEIEKYMGEKLRNLGLITNTEKTEIRKYYPHLASHFLGLDVHDIGNYDEPLKVGMVITVEPGIYIPEESLGVRIEDDVLITDKGPKILSQLAPKQLW